MKKRLPIPIGAPIRWRGVSAETSTPTTTETLEVLEGAPNYRRWLRSLASPHLGSRLLDIGSGTGYVTEVFTDREAVVALEGYATYIPRLRERFAAQPHVKVLHADITDQAVLPQLAAADLDSAVSFNVFEHIEDDRLALRHVHQVLRPGGTLVLFVPASMSIYSELDRHLGHHRRYVRGELIAKAREAGFEVRRVRHVNLPGYFAWFVNSRLARGRGFVGGTAMVSRYDRLAIPAIAWLERRVRVPFGQSLLLVAAKPEA